MIKNLIRKSDLLGAIGCPEDRDRILNTAYHIQDNELEDIRNSGRLIDRIFAASQMLYEKVSNGINLDRDDASAQFSGMNLAAIVRGEWDDPVRAEKSVYGAIDRYFRHEDVLDYQSSSRLRIPYIHRLRESIGVYTGNLIEAADHFPEFDISSDDLLNSHRIPLSLGFDDYLLLGIFWADGWFAEKDGDIDKGYFAIATGQVKDNGEPENDPSMKFYNDVSSRIKETFNIATRAIIVNTESRYIDDLGVEYGRYSHPRIAISSKALRTWLYRDMGYENKKNDGHESRLPEFSMREQAEGFLVGYIAAKGKFHRTDRPRIVISSSDQDFMAQIAGLLDDLGYKSSSPNISSRQMVISDKKFFIDFRDRGWFMHPYHAELARNISY